VMLALLVTLQAVTKSAGQYVTGSCVNLILAVTALTAGLGSGAAVAALSPFFAFLLGIGPQLLPIVPAIALGNLAYVVLLWALAGAAALLLIGMNAAYIWGIVSSPSAEQLAAKEAPNWFIVTQLCGTLIALYFWIEVLITDLVKRRADERRQQAVDLGE